MRRQRQSEVSKGRCLQCDSASLNCMMRHYTGVKNMHKKSNNLMKKKKIFHECDDNGGENEVDKEDANNHSDGIRDQQHYYKSA